MARPMKRRRICELPQNSRFRPCTGQNPETIELTIDEYETIRLIDHMGLSQDDCAAQMNVARTTVQAIYDTARKKLADMLVNGKQLHISGGCYDLCPHGDTCCKKSCSHRRCQSDTCEQGWSDCPDCQKTVR